MELVLTKLHAGGKFGGGGYKISGGLHGVGLSVVNALSEWLEVEVCQNGHVYKQVYNRGIPQRALAVVGDTDKTGTKVTFYPDSEIFETIVFNYDNLKVRLRELAYLNKGLTISLEDQRGEKPRFDEFRYDGGILHFVEDINKNKEVLFDQPVYFEDKQDDYAIEVAIQYNDGYNELIMSIIRKTIETNPHVEGILFDGFPRNISQAKLLENLMEELGTPFTGVLSLEVPREELITRLINRGKVSGRSDDKEDVILERLKEYEEKTLPVAEYFSKKGNFYPVKGVGSLEEIFDRLVAEIEKHRR